MVHFTDVTPCFFFAGLRTGGVRFFPPCERVLQSSPACNGLTRRPAPDPWRPARRRRSRWSSSRGGGSASRTRYCGTSSCRTWGCSGGRGGSQGEGGRARRGGGSQPLVFFPPAAVSRNSELLEWRVWDFVLIGRTPSCSVWWISPFLFALSFF